MRYIVLQYTIIYSRHLASGALPRRRHTGPFATCFTPRGVNVRMSGSAKRFRGGACLHPADPPQPHARELDMLRWIASFATMS